MYKYKIDKVYDKYTIKDYLESFKLSKSKINRIINEKRFRVNNEIIYTLKENDILEIEEELFNENEVNPLFEDIEILYEDDYLLIVNKEKNTIIHSDQINDRTLDRIVSGYLGKKSLKMIPRHIYRLDKDTKGCMVFAKDPLTLSFLSKSVEIKELYKVYRAIVHGKIEQNKGTINKPIGTNRHKNGVMVISSTGKNAVTHYQVIKKTEDYTLVELQLETGRTHQIRVHLASINHPILGDKIYGIDNNTDMQLEASSVSFIHPINKKRLTIEVSHKLSM